MAKSPTLADLIAEVQSLRAQTVDIPFDTPGHLVAGKELARNVMKAQLAEKQKVLDGLLPKAAAAIFVDGIGRVKFAEIAEDIETISSITIDASDFYRSIAREWFPQVRRDGTFQIDCITQFVGSLHAKLYPLGVQAMRPPNFTGFLGRDVSDFVKAINLTRDIIRDAVGDDLVALYIQSQLTEKVLAVEEWGGSSIPVVIINATPEETETLLPKLFTGRNITFTADANIEKNDVIIAFKHLRAKLNPNSKPPKAPAI